MLYTLVRSVIWTLLHLFYALSGGIRYEGRENVPKTGGVLITPNHISDADPTAIGLALPRSAWMMAKEELFQTRFLGPFIRALHAFPIKRYTADRAALRLTEDLLQKGNAVVIFPEGKLSETGELQPLLPGPLLIAQRAKVPIVPAIVTGTERILPYGATRPKLSHHVTTVRFGKPVTVDELKGDGKGSEALKQGAERLGEIMLALQQEARGAAQIEK